MKRSLHAAAAVLSIFAGSTFAGTAAAGEAQTFAEKGQFILSADRLFPLFSYTRVGTTTNLNGTTNKDSTSGASIALFYGAEPAGGSFNTVPRLAFDYAVIDHLTVGGSIILAVGLSATNTQESSVSGQTTKTEVDAPKSTVFGFAPRVGYALSLTDSFVFWPRAGVSLFSVSTKSTRQNGANTTTAKDGDTIFAFNLEPMFVFAPFRNVFFQAGPVLDVSFSGSRTTEVSTGATSTKTDTDLSVLHFGGQVGLGVNF